MSELFLGLDSSTQSLSAILIDFQKKEILMEKSINFDQNLPHYNTQGGVIRAEDPKVVHSYPLMWAEALDILFEEIKKDGIDLSSIKAISGSGQQHGSVYMKSHAKDTLRRLDPKVPLYEQIKDIFSRPTSPVWMDSSTTRQCEEIRKRVGGKDEIVRLSGSDTFERFTGPQIRKFYEESPDKYFNTVSIQLVSSFMASLLLGDIGCIDYGDGAGMNLMDIKERKWHPLLLDATAPQLEKRLPLLMPSDTVLGTVSRYFVERYGLSPDTQVVIWSGDNPNSLIGLGLISMDKAAISLGTSDTYFGFMSELHTDPRGEGHVFCAPTGDYMTLICFKNGSLARERVRDKFKLDWNGFSRALQETPPGNNSGIMLPYFEPEIVPLVLSPKVYRFNLREDDAYANCRAVVEAQMLSMKIHSRWMGTSPGKIYATGGASENTEILKIMANVHQAEVYRLKVKNSANLGAALRAAHAYYKSRGIFLSWQEVVADFTSPLSGSEIKPDPSTASIYEHMASLYKQYEDSVLGISPESI